MTLTAFTSGVGAGQGRLRTAKATSGEHAFVLGEDEPGRVFELAPGDFTEVVQSVDLTDAKLLRVLLRLRVPASTPGLAWEAALVVGGTKLARVRARAGHDRLVTDMAANVSKFAGGHEVGVRLELVNA